MIRPRPEKPDAKAPPVPTVDNGRPTPEQLTRYLNSQAAMLQSIESRDLSIDIRSPAANVGLDGGSLLCQKPRYFRLIGKKFGSQEVLVGSNEERFWFFVKRDPSDALFHCSYTDFDKGAIDLPFPFEPEWVLEALGMGTVDPNGSFRVEDDKNSYVLIEDTTLRGRKIRKETVFYKGTARGDQPQVKTRTMFDDRNRIICTATIKSVTRIPVDRGANAKSSVVVCPQSIKLEWPAQETELILELGRVQVNERLSMEAFQMPRLGSREVDLGRDRPTSRSGIIPVRGRP
ncbi:MAG: hypothetical protein EXS09_07310 [Gemmataceae bacterium]|nr:hypothetical protein [Gemmataceae bacterium]